MSGAAPNLFVVGASKAGTSSLHAYLSHHPDIAGARPKEPCFFVDRAELAAAWPVMARHPASHDWDAYCGLFAARPDARWRFEGSVYYAQAPHFSGVPARIAARLPHARIVYLVRHPVERTISHYWQRVRMLQETRPIEEAVVPGSIYVDTSDYAAQLEAYLAHFDRATVKVLAAEDLRDRRQAVLDDLFGWLGVPPLPLDAVLEGERHVTAPVSRAPRMRLVRAVRDSRAWQAARAMLPEPARATLRRLAVREFARSSVNEGATRRFLAEYFPARAARLDTLLGSDHARRWFPPPPAPAADAR